MLHAALHVRLDGEVDLGALATRLNAFVHENVYPGRYITFFAGVLDGAHHRLTTVNAGHPAGRVLPVPSRSRRFERSRLVNRGPRMG